jgi:hypothetical protein
MTDIMHETESDISDISEDIYEDNEVKYVHSINTYNDWKNLNGIDEIIITHKKMYRGFLKLKNGQWRKLYNNKDVNFDYTKMETLLWFVEKRQSDIIKLYDIKSNTYEYISFEEFCELRKNFEYFNYNYTFEYIDSIYNIKSIMNDIVDKCFIENIKTHKDYDHLNPQFIYM